MRVDFFVASVPIASVLGLVSRDISDNDCVATVLARDALNRFRGFDVHINAPSQADAEKWLEERLAELLPYPREHSYQRDEKGAPVDFFTPECALQLM